MPVRDSFCNFCGTKYPDTSSYPRTCPGCKAMVWANPIPVSVVLAPVVDGGRTGLLVIRRAIPPVPDKLALPGGFVEDHESWQAGGAREVREESNVVVGDELEPLWFVSTEPRPNRILLFGVARPVVLGALAPFERNSETSERGVVYGPDGLDTEFCFALHAEAARRYFRRQGITGGHGFTAC